MEVRCHDDVEEFSAHARPLLDADPVRHTVALTVLEGLRRSGDRPAVLATVAARRSVVGAVLRTPARPVLVSALPSRCAAPAAAVLAELDPELPGACGPAAEVDAFAAAFVARTGASTHVTLRLRLFALDELAPPHGVPGAPRLACERDLDLLAAWRLLFAEEVDRGWVGPESPRESAARVLRLGYAQVLWEVEGVPVALASANPPVAGMSRIGPVYTAAEHRGRGYGSAVTAAASAWALAAGAAHVLLFTDLTNPTTNAIYPRIGYRPVHDAVDLAFRKA